MVYAILEEESRTFPHFVGKNQQSSGSGSLEPYFLDDSWPHHFGRVRRALHIQATGNEAAKYPDGCGSNYGYYCNKHRADMRWLNQRQQWQWQIVCSAALRDTFATLWIVERHRIRLKPRKIDRTV
ncbi:hypothetical protein ACJJTC_006195 [Scirpophaga incertulas]